MTKEWGKTYVEEMAEQIEVSPDDIVMKNGFITSQDYRHHNHRDLLVKSKAQFKRLGFEAYDKPIGVKSGPDVLADYSLRYNGKYYFVECLTRTDTDEINRKLRLEDYAPLILVFFDTQNARLRSKVCEYKAMFIAENSRELSEQMLLQMDK